MEEIKRYTLEDDEELRSFDLSALFTCVAVDEALTVVKDKLNADTTLASRTSLAADEVTNSLELCLKCTFFTFQGEYYLQIHGAAMGSPVSQIICNHYMENFERKT